MTHFEFNKYKRFENLYLKSPKYSYSLQYNYVPILLFVLSTCVYTSEK